MNKTKPDVSAIESAWDPIYQALFRIDGNPDLDLSGAVIALCDAINKHDGEGEDWFYIGEHTETTLSDFIVGAYWAFSEWHAGQSSDSYRALCALGSIFSPGMTGAPEEDGDNTPSEWEAYDAINTWFLDHNPVTE